MPDSKQTRTSSTKKDTPTVSEQPSAQAGETASANAEKLAGELDDLLDEIDSVLEENAEEFVKSYVQKGGQ